MKKKKGNRKTLIVILLIIFLAVSFVVVYILSGLKPQGAVYVSLLSDKTEIKAGEVFLVTVKIDSGETGVEAADFVVVFDPEFLSVKDQKVGQFFPNYPISTKGEDFVKFSGMAGFDGKKVNVPKGKGDVGFITFMTKRAGTTKITVDQDKTIVAEKGKNVLNTKALKEVNIKIE